jgi:hypothetical protein
MKENSYYDKLIYTGLQGMIAERNVILRLLLKMMIDNGVHDLIITKDELTKDEGESFLVQNKLDQEEPYYKVSIVYPGQDPEDLLDETET